MILLNYGDYVLFYYSTTFSHSLVNMCSNSKVYDVSDSLASSYFKVQGDFDFGNSWNIWKEIYFLNPDVLL